ncbi:MAG: hypothetical protein K2G47_06230 [Muribaculum sp.]|nr:hypothetical protein [Muribaculum sp.]
MSKELASKVAMTEDSPTVKDMATKVPSQSYRIPVAFFYFTRPPLQPRLLPTGITTIILTAKEMFL